MSDAWDQLAVGSDYGPRTVGPLTRTDFVRYQGASGDMNPVHHDELFARAAGFEAPLGIGMLHAGAVAAWAAEWLGADHVRRVRVRWKAPVWPGDVLVFRASVTGFSEDDAGRHAEVELLCAKDDGSLVLQGWMSFTSPG